MPNKDTDQRLEKLRQRAENQVGRDTRPGDLREALELARELQIHQVELEMQNQELRSAQVELSKAHELYYKIFNLAPVGFVRLSDRQHILEANHGAEEIFERTAKDLERTSLFSLINLDCLDAFKKHFIKASSKNSPARDQVTLKESGKVVQLFSVALDRVDDHKGFFTALVDTTIRSKMEKQLRMGRNELKQEQARLQAILDQMPAGLLLAEAPSGRVVMENAEAQRIMEETGLNIKDREQYYNGELQDPDGQALEPEQYPLDRALLRGETVKQEKVTRPDQEGKTRVISVNAAPVFGHGGDIMAAVLTFQDITEPEETRRKLNDMNYRLEELVAERTAELKAQTIKLQEANTALKVLLETRDQDRRNQEETVMANLNQLVMPVVKRLRENKSPSAQDSLLEALEEHLQTLTSGFTPVLTSVQFQLSPRELEVAGLIKKGKTSDEIAEILGISPSSILFHRNNIRGKLGLKGKKQRLSTYLQNIS